ncbi:MAG: hypothetical protein EOP11_19570 [Proteobacteria bacterium]|nr:MAG: hypothetical protein EOP11_19570 [Pseudomonadota bacterium]
MFSRNALLFVATTLALGAGSASGMPGVPKDILAKKITASAEIAAMDTLSAENVRLEASVQDAGVIGGCVALRDFAPGEALQPKDLACAGPTMGLRQTHLDPHNL